MKLTPDRLWPEMKSWSPERWFSFNVGDEIVLRVDNGYVAPSFRWRLSQLFFGGALVVYIRSERYRAGHSNIFILFLEKIADENNKLLNRARVKIIYFERKQLQMESNNCQPISSAANFSVY